MVAAQPKLHRNGCPARATLIVGWLSTGAKNPLNSYLIGGVTTAAVTVAGVVVVGMGSLWRCGGFFGESLAVPGTLSEQLCRSSTGEVTFVILVVAQLVTGLAGTAGAVGARDMRWLFPALAIAGTIPAAVALLFLVSGSL